MKIFYLSDLHLEHYHPEKAKSKVRKIKNTDICDCAVFAGDIGLPWQEEYQYFLKHVSEEFPKVFLITGNHEYYTNMLTKSQIDTYIEQLVSNYNNIVFLNNTIHEWNGFTWIGTTLWSNINPTPTVNINDTLFMSKELYRYWHNKSVDFLSCQNSDNNIIITHHLPSNKLIHKEFIGNPYNPWFSSDLDYLITKLNPKLWIYGHTHKASEKKVSNVLCVCNPVGYPGENTECSMNKVIEI